MSSTFAPGPCRDGCRGSARRGAAYEASAPSAANAPPMRLFTAFVLQTCRPNRRRLAYEHRDRHAPGALARDHPVGRPHHARRGSRPGGTQSSLRWRRARAAQRVVPLGLALALAMSCPWPMNHCGVLRKITGFFERHECGYWCFSRPRAMIVAGFAERLDHRVVGVALVALFGEETACPKPARPWSARRRHRR